MKTGFLARPAAKLAGKSSEPSTQTKQPAQQHHGRKVAFCDDEPAPRSSAGEDQAADAGLSSPADGQRSDPAITDPEALARNFEQCMALLKGPTDEQR